MTRSDGFVGPVARLAFFAVVLLCGCSSSHFCGYTCVGDQRAIFHLSCGPSDLVSVGLTGACATDDASPSDYVFGPTSGSLAIGSSLPGTCHVVLTFANGYVYAQDVTFAAQKGLGGCCPDFIAPTQQDFTVSNPPETCTDAGVDAGEDG